jgi:ferredoxin
VAGLKEHLGSNNYRFYICGPEPMMNQFEEDLAAWGVPDEDILSERFAPPAKKRPAEGMTPKSIRFAKSNKEVQFTADDANILDVAERAGIPISFDCRAGSCGSCKVGVVSGKVKETIRTNYKCAPGSCLTCSCLPETDIVLDC